MNLHLKVQTERHEALWQWNFTANARDLGLLVRGSPTTTEE